MEQALPGKYTLWFYGSLTSDQAPRRRGYKKGRNNRAATRWPEGGVERGPSGGLGDYPEKIGRLSFQQEVLITNRKDGTILD